MREHSSNTGVRRRPVQVSVVENNRNHAQHLQVAVSENGSSVMSDRRSQAATWDASSQASTAPFKSSSMGSPGLDRPISASYSTSATEPSLADTGKLKKLGPLHEHLGFIKEYEPGETATETWAEIASEFDSSLANGDRSPGAAADSNSWTFWEKMVNLADALATAKYLDDAFDLHYICFMEIFADTRKRLMRWESASPQSGNNDQDRKASKMIVGTPTVLQLLIRTAIGAARSCTTASESKLARVMLDATHSVLRHTKNSNHVRAVLVLFDIYRNTLMEIWNEHVPVPQEFCTLSLVSPKSSRLNQEYSLDDLLRFIHPAIINREYLTVSTHLLRLMHNQRTWPNLPAQSTAWERPLAQFMRNLASPSKTGQAWLELVKARQPVEPPHFLEAYMRESNAFLRWCINAIFEGKTALDESFALEGQSPYVVSREDLNNARLTLFWFLVGRKKLMEVHSPSGARSASTGLPKFPHSDNSPAAFDAFFVLSSFIFGFCIPTCLPVSLPSISDYVMDGLRLISKWPYGFVWHYLQYSVSCASRLHTDGDFMQAQLDRKHLDAALLGSDDVETIDASAAIPVELHPQPLPEFTTEPDPHTNNPSSPQSKPSSPRSQMKVSFAESPESSSPAKASKRRWLQRLSGSITRLDAATLQALGDKSSPTKSKTATSPSLSAGTRTPSGKSSANSSKRASLAISRDARLPRQSSSSIDAVCRIQTPDDLPSDDHTIAPLMSSPASTSTSTSEHAPMIGKLPFEQPSPVMPPVDAEKTSSVVHSTEILLPDSRPPFVVLH